MIGNRIHRQWKCVSIVSFFIHLSVDKFNYFVFLFFFFSIFWILISCSIKITKLQLLNYHFKIVIVRKVVISVFFFLLFCVLYFLFFLCYFLKLPIFSFDLCWTLNNLLSLFNQQRWQNWILNQNNFKKNSLSVCVLFF